MANLVERLMIVCPDDLIGPEYLTEFMHNAASTSVGISEDEYSLKQAVYELEKRYISQALAEHGSTHKAAKALGVSQPTVLRKARKFGIPMGQ